MQIIEVEINKIKPDPDQPRQYIDAEEINGMDADLITPSRRADPLITPANDSEM